MKHLFHNWNQHQQQPSLLGDMVEIGQDLELFWTGGMFQDNHLIQL